MHQQCKEMKNVLDHITSCTAEKNMDWTPPKYLCDRSGLMKPSCPVPYCQSYRHMIFHGKNCSIPKNCCGIPYCWLTSYSEVAIPILPIKEWHASVNPDLRSHLVAKL